MKTILIVEDHLSVAGRLQRSLEQLHYHAPAIAVTGTEALTLTEQHQPDLVLMDFIMPEMDGFEITREIRRTEGSGQKAEGKDTAGENDDNQKSKIENQKSKIPIIALSASAFEQTRQQSA